MDLAKIENNLKKISKPWRDLWISNEKERRKNKIFNIINDIIENIDVDVEENNNDDMTFTNTTITIDFIKGFKLNYQYEDATDCTSESKYTFYDTTKDNVIISDKKVFFENLLSEKNIHTNDHLIFELIYDFDELLKELVEERIDENGW